jgi:hypothetical protein
MQLEDFFRKPWLLLLPSLVSEEAPAELEILGDGFTGRPGTQLCHGG